MMQAGDSFAKVLLRPSIKLSCVWCCVSLPLIPCLHMGCNSFEINMTTAVHNPVYTSFESPVERRIGGAVHVMSHNQECSV